MKKLLNLLAVVFLASCGGEVETVASTEADPAVSDKPVPAAADEVARAAKTGAEAVAYTNFTLFDGRQETAAPGKAVLVRNGRIAWLGDASALDPDAASRTVDLSGKYVMPGLIDLHVHIGNTHEHRLAQSVDNYTRESVDRSLETYAAYGVTTVLVMGTDPDLIFTIRAERKDAQPPMARIFTAGQGIVFANGYGGIAPLNRPVSTPEEARREVAAQADRNVDVVKLWLDDEFGTMPKMPSEITAAVIDEAHKHGLRALAHIFYLEDAKRLVEQGIDGFVHSVRDQPVDEELIDGMRAGSVWQMGTLSREAALLAYGTEAPFLDDPFFTSALSPQLLATLTDPDWRQSMANAPHFGEYRAVLEHALANYERLVEADVEYAMGTDAGPPGRFAGFAAHWELELMVEAGLTPFEALAAATGRAAEFLRAPDIGIIEEGRAADFIVLDANPLEDIRNTRELHAVYVAGQPVEPIGP